MQKCSVSDKPRKDAGIPRYDIILNATLYTDSGPVLARITKLSLGGCLTLYLVAGGARVSFHKS
jgi:hypothetical protein